MKTHERKASAQNEESAMVCNLALPSSTQRCVLVAHTLHFPVAGHGGCFRIDPAVASHTVSLFVTCPLDFHLTSQFESSAIILLNDVCQPFGCWHGLNLPVVPHSDIVPTCLGAVEIP
jgi:hypothetical protein